MNWLEWKPLSVVASLGQTRSRVSPKYRCVPSPTPPSPPSRRHRRDAQIVVSGLGAYWVGLSSHPCLPLLTPTSVQQSSFRSTGITRFIATASPAAAVSSSPDFPGSPVIRPTCLCQIRCQAAAVRGFAVGDPTELTPQTFCTFSRDSVVVSGCSSTGSGKRLFSTKADRSDA
jgi:hypothetical protein